MKYPQIHKKWARVWSERGTNKFDALSKKPKYYALEMFPYPSASNLHIGHFFNFAPADTHARFRRMTGHNVFHPMGFDSFGLPSENYAIKMGTHPSTDTQTNVVRFRAQLDSLGGMFDWDYGVVTSNPEYYKWTQWLFLQLYKAGLAYQKEAATNWCDSCQTVLANEQVESGACERCKNTITRKSMKQWFFKITDYADRLLEGLEGLDWPKKTKTMQENWIGKSVGHNINWVVGGEGFLTFTTRIDTISGVTFLVLSPEHPLVNRVTTADKKADVEKYVAEANKKTDLERIEVKDKTGVFTGAFASHPVSGEKIPIWVADYVLVNYGTGAVMGVPAEDERDEEFAKKYNIEIRPVDYSITHKADAVTTYRLRDWSVGRQRYWGSPIPIIYCDKCGVVPVPESQLPVVLPHLVDFKPKGVAPLASSPDFTNTTCPTCGGAATRETDTLDTFVCSAWYFLRYPSTNDETKPLDDVLTKKLLPVDCYVGGAEHACMHLLYARFVTMALCDMGHINFSEPFKRLVHQGMILGPDGVKMAKSRGNVISPDTYTDVFGSDILRLYMLFGFNYTDGGPWKEDGVKNMVRFVERIERLVEKATNTPETDDTVNHVRATTIKQVREDVGGFSFNTAVARCMEFINALYAAETVTTESVRDLVLLTAPMMPHLAEELMSALLKTTPDKKEWVSVFDMDYPTPDEKFLQSSTVEIVVQINSKIVTRVVVPTNATQEQVVALVDAPVNFKKIIYIKNKLINFIV